MIIFRVLIVFEAVIIVNSATELYFDDTSKSISSKDEKTVENIMSMIQETCTRDNRGKTVKQLKKDSNSILNIIKEYRHIVNIKQAMQRDIKWIVKESKGHGGVESFMTAIKRGVKDICRPFRARDCSELRKIKKKSGVYIIYPDPSKGSKGIEAYCDMKTDGGGWTVIQKRTDGSVNFQCGWTEYENGFGKTSGEYWLGNRLSAHNGYKFTTVDQDNDIWNKNCAAVFGGGWWFINCYSSFLNGKFQGKMYWANICKKAAMMIRKL